MNIQVPTALLDGSVLALLAKEDTYGYIITKAMQDLLGVSESTMYPVLRRLKKDGYLETYDQPFEGRIRRYYRLTETGQAHLTEIKAAWGDFRQAINSLLEEK
ncbi:PadR family transcriptional regulator [Weissella cibaria]|uniref:PadR family transcriptional regulator n=1 Tax=Weissella cibaria TaxID=137591 RepID=A0A1X4JN57_9LACO|nr:PadR family transcriptional regulator [Weissella cibaria]MDH5012542.1 PadR family transcriptional regulator [Weissella cibaria]OSP90206.1 PadR family transcriptional regulator [Weissella cibaria]